jgi:uncharacterized protein YabN with tetrapyrrole methylase and pyrophosphatase domain
MNVIQKLKDLYIKSDKFGFMWPNAEMMIDQIISEAEELREVLVENQGRERLVDEMGDVLHACLELCFYMQLDPIEPLEHSSQKYSKRFDALEEVAKEKGYKTLKGESIEHLLQLWGEAKKRATKK